jgi:hypothetical protein
MPTIEKTDEVSEAERLAALQKFRTILHDPGGTFEQAAESMTILGYAPEPNEFTKPEYAEAILHDKWEAARGRITAWDDLAAQVARLRERFASGVAALGGRLPDVTLIRLRSQVNNTIDKILKLQRDHPDEFGELPTPDKADPLPGRYVDAVASSPRLLKRGDRHPMEGAVVDNPPDPLPSQRAGFHNRPDKPGLFDVPQTSRRRDPGIYPGTLR